MACHFYLKDMQVVPKAKLRGFKRGSLYAVRDALSAHGATIEAKEWREDGQDVLLAPDFPVRLDMIRVTFAEENRSGVEAALRHFGLVYSTEWPYPASTPALQEVLPAW